MDENINLIFLELLLAIPLVGVVLWFVYRMSKNHNSNIEEIISKVVQEKNESSSKHNLEKIDLTLKPFKEQLRNLNEEIVGLKEEQAASKESFKDHVSKIIEQTDNIGKEASDLALALSGNVQTQGAWGEQVLEKTLEEYDLVTEYKIEKFNSKNIIYKIVFNSSPDKFLEKMLSLKFKIDTTKDIWELK